VEITAAVAENHLSSDEFRIVAGQESDQARQMFGLNTLL
jgi:hypothetical protein